MPKYRVTALVTISMNTEVEADNPQEACDLAEERATQGLCYQCANGRGIDEEWRTSGELDGSPHDLRAERID